MDDIVNAARETFARLATLAVEDRIEAINRIRAALHEFSPMKREPVDCVLWVPAKNVIANDYNPNIVAAPEMRLLQRSIMADGYTQPIVTWRTDGGGIEVVDGFHRTRVGREVGAISKRVYDRLPITIVNDERNEKADRIAATIRHNRARGKHTVAGMSDIVVDLKRRNWTDERIGKELGMEPDEVLRLAQISGLAELFTDRAFSEAWEA